MSEGTMKKLKDLDTHDRPREKIARNGPAALSDQELIAAIIGSGTRGKDVLECARDILEEIRRDPGEIRYDRLSGIKGVGPVKASQIGACFELSRRYLKPAAESPIRVLTPGDLYPELSWLAAKRQEHFVSVTLNGAGEVIAQRTITVGLLNHSLVHPREVYADAIADRAASLICAHNHPSGSTEPSPQDIEITRQLVHAGEILGIRLLDHIIVGRNAFLSMREKGLI
ncbi:MAG: DNA repair protein RadC [Methanoregulaceae archaeon]|jgi:DNA repair protein RadC|nr:DNA repair protein RadC [Methanoregulaceae archaeon]